MKRLIFSSRADQDYYEIVHYLDENFGIEKAVSFEKSLREKLLLIKTQPFAFGFFFDTDCRKCLINPYITMLYRITETRIEIIAFWFNRADPDKIKEFLIT
ncbi:MAG: type II toxin-antitoxin system RelE/ParE family toxin [Flavobacteriaceae bacterium]|jgi:plasmid stabilization system protein ParE|nr:type II toxin-antitoxin system RelE/ParE family toxin [Flavobacteriaceae bacterium]